MNLRPAAVPLITVDPFFSIWSCADKLYNDTTRHWSDKPCPILAGILVNGEFITIAAANKDLMRIKRRMYQTSLNITPMSTEYEFEDDNARVKLTFTTPLLLDRFDIMTRPASYIKYDITPKCGKDVDIKFIFGINSRICVDDTDQDVVIEKTDYSLRCGNTKQNPLSKSGDSTTIDWGWLHLCDTDAQVYTCSDCDHFGTNYIRKEDEGKTVYNVRKDMPYLAVVKDELSGVITVAYDQIHPIEYFGDKLDEYYTKHFSSFGDMVNAAVSEYTAIKKMCDAFDAKLMAEASALDDNYAKILSLAYRQAIASHKLVEDRDGNILFFSKECDSNGCIGTLDVTYPSIPIFLKYRPELVLGMLKPIIKYAKSDAWPFEFTPHDVGQYPLANGQAYGMTYEKQMPVEEAGNMLLCVAAVAKYSDEGKTFFAENRDILKKWADYLVEYGYDPENQLCTDDFAGHLAHNCNLSLKAILGIAAYGMLTGDASYTDKAKEYACKWQNDAKSACGATRLTFNDANGWSLKYNMVWDKLLGFNLFPEDIKKTETALYLSKLNRYGVPLDSRKDYTKIDWLMWSTCLSDNPEYFKNVCQSIVNMINETSDRVPLADWYFTSTAEYVHFQNRTVVGGLFINLL